MSAHRHAQADLDIIDWWSIGTIAHCQWCARFFHVVSTWEQIPGTHSRAERERLVSHEVVEVEFDNLRFSEAAKLWSWHETLPSDFGTVEELNSPHRSKGGIRTSPHAHCMKSGRSVSHRMLHSKPAWAFSSRSHPRHSSASARLSRALHVKQESGSDSSGVAEPRKADHVRLPLRSL
jgi:hypothetical protein